MRLRASATTAARTAPPAASVAGKPSLAAASPSIAVARLVRAAGDFIVSRKMPSGGEGSTVIAGYPWFADWGRDTMISLPGLFLVTGRFEQARQVLSVFAQYCSEGMIPNRFDDYTNEPSYNTVDASLWFIHAVFEYLRYTGDRATFDKLLRPACQSIIDGYRKGTRYISRWTRRWADQPGRRPHPIDMDGRQNQRCCLYAATGKGRRDQRASGITR